MSPETSGQFRRRSIILFFAIFPIFNAVADFASVGLTRYLLRNGLKHRAWLKACVDLFGGAVIFALLGITLITYLHWVIPSAGQPLINLSGLFDDLNNRPQDMWWLFAMLFSTLIPTALHLMVGVLTIGLAYPRLLRHGIAKLLRSGRKGSAFDSWLGSKLVCLLVTLSCWLPILGLYLLFTANHGWVLRQVIAFFHWYAGAIGAL